jgi:hypothetical protein
MRLEKVKVIYATGPGGIHVTIPLLKAGAYDVGDMRSRLKAAGIQDDQLPYVVFSTEQAIAPHLRDDIGPADIPGLSLAADPHALPDIPKPTQPNTPLPRLSEFKLVASVLVTPRWRQITGCRYSMRRADNNGYVCVQDLQPGDFENPDDYAKINNDRIKLCMGWVWRLVAENFLNGEGEGWNRTEQSKHGMSVTNAVSVSASVGYSGGGASASISATYSYSVTVDDERTVTTSVNINGEAGVSKTVALWELCRVYFIEVDGVRYDDPAKESLTVVFKDKGGPHQLLDTWGVTYEVYSQGAEVLAIPFKIGS